MTRATFRAFKCRMGVHRWMWQDIYVCADCRFRPFDRRKTVTADARFNRGRL